MSSLNFVHISHFEVGMKLKGIIFDTTKDVELPEGFTVPNKTDCEKIHEKIKEVINSGRLLDLTEVLSLAYKG